jgi:GNAT superfamily N-acetyltransferase
VDEPIRVAAGEDLDRVTRTLWLAFCQDPLWSWAFPERTKLEPWWRFLIGSALRHEWVWVLGDFAAASVWIPPGCEELSPDEEEQVEDLLQALVGERASAVLALLKHFEDSHPATQPHYYLSLLGTHPDHGGKGLGMRLLADNLRRIDSAQAPAYLESSNPRNDLRYEGVGFRRVGSFSTPDDAHVVTTMWRAAATPR